MMRVGILACVLALVACDAETGEDEGGGASVGAVRTFAELDRDVFARWCTAACHSGGEFAAGGLDMSGNAHAALVEGPPVTDACASLGMARVVPGDPEHSLLYLKIAAKAAGTPAPCGDAMPSGANKVALTDAEVASVRAWIAAGAKDD